MPDDLENEKEKLLENAKKNVTINDVFQIIELYNENYKKIIEDWEKSRYTPPKVISSNSTLPII